MDAFRPIMIEDKPTVNPYLLQYPCNEGSECTFSNLYIWGKAEDIRWAIEDDCLLLRIQEKGDKPCMLMALAPEERLDRAIDLAVESMHNRGDAFRMVSLPAWYVERMEKLFPGRFVFDREPHHDDYIYSGESLRTLAGSKFHGKRNHINKFQSLYGERCAYETYSDAHFSGCMALEENWALMQSDREGITPAAARLIAEEAESVRRALTGAGALGLTGGVILVDGIVRAFTLGERIRENMVLIHVEKADISTQGAYAMINREFLEREFPDAAFVNREEDMGDEGLRRAKRSYGPIRMVEKFGARLK